MKKILLLGDSIRKGYDRYVKESMANIAEVCYPEQNCQHTTNILRDLHNWISNLKCNDADAVHWNVGHWDTLKIYGDDCLTRPEVYADNLERISKRLEFLLPNAVQIFATSTPVIESGYLEGFEMRYNADVERYNEIAKEVLGKRGVIINDLYALVKDNHERLQSDQSHYYTADGTEVLGSAVNEIICDTLRIDKKLLVLPDKNDFAVTCYKNDNELYVKIGDYYEMVQGI